MKPKTDVAMQQLINEIRFNFPFTAAPESFCAANCYGCPKKLMLYLETELDGWQCQLDDGIIPLIGDINRLAKTARKIYKVLLKNKLVPPTTAD